MSTMKFDPARLPAPDEMRFELAFVDFDADGEEDDVRSWFAHDGLTVEEMKSIMERWVPTPPSGDGWILVSKYDTEYGPSALFIRDIQSSEAGG